MSYGMMISWGSLGLILSSGCVAPAPDRGSVGATDPAPNGSKAVDMNAPRVDVEDGHTDGTGVAAPLVAEIFARSAEPTPNSARATTAEAGADLHAQRIRGD